MKPTGVCDRCGGDYKGDLPAFERRLCAKCVKIERSRRGASFGTFHHFTDRDKLPSARTARALDLEKVPWIDPETFKS